MGGFENAFFNLKNQRKPLEDTRFWAQAFCRHFSCALRGTTSMKRHENYLKMAENTLIQNQPIFRHFSNPLFCAPALCHPLKQAWLSLLHLIASHRPAHLQHDYTTILLQVGDVLQVQAFPSMWEAAMIIMIGKHK